MNKWPHKGGADEAAVPGDANLISDIHWFVVHDRIS